MTKVLRPCLLIRDDDPNSRGPLVCTGLGLEAEERQIHQHQGELAIFGTLRTNAHEASTVMEQHEYFPVQESPLHLSSSLSLFAAMSLTALVGCQQNGNTVELKVAATLASSTCGAAVTVENTQEFHVVLTRDDDVLTWYSKDSGVQIEGSVDSDSQVVLATTSVIAVSEGTMMDPGCSVRRHDAYSGTLKESTGGEITGVDIEVVSTYTEANNYTCDVLIGAPGGFTDLPCEVAYDLLGTKE